MREKTCLQNFQGTLSITKDFLNLHSSLHLPRSSAFSQTNIHSKIKRVKPRHVTCKEATTPKQAILWLVDPRGPFGINTAPLPAPSLCPHFGIDANFLSWQGLDSINTEVGVSQVHDGIVTSEHCSEPRLGLKQFSSLAFGVQECQEVVSDARCVFQMSKSIACSVPLHSLSPTP